MLASICENEIATETPDPKIAARSKLDAVICRVTVVLVLLLAVASFALSFEALSELAAKSGAIAPQKAWIFPLLIDGAVIIFSTAALRASLFGRTDWWSIGLVITTTLASIVLNIAHAHATVSSCLVAAMPPLLLGLSYESLLRQLSATLRPVQAVPARRPRPKPKPVAKSVPATREAAPKPTDDKREHALRLLTQGVSKRAIARELNMAPATIRRLAGGLELQPTA
ncbi:MAG: DUF2637 domain-containing protein [Verrucomicrobiota bacterium]